MAQATFDPEQYDQGHYDELIDDIDDSSDVASNAYQLPKTNAPIGSAERSSIADPRGFDENTLRGSILRGKPRVLTQNSEKFKDLELDEVVNLLEDHNVDVRANAAGYLQHLSYNNDDNKNDIRNCGGIPKLIDILEERNDDPRIIENTTGALRNISYGIDQNKISINVAEGVAALNKSLRRATAKLEDQQGSQSAQWSLVQVHSAGALWNLSSHKLIKQPMLDQCLTTIISCVLVPWAKHMSNAGSSIPPSKYEDVFTAVSGILRNLSSFSPKHGEDTARDRMRQTDGLVDSMVDIVSNVTHYKEDILTSKYFENIVCALRNLTFKCSKDQERARIPQIIVTKSCCSTKREEPKYEKPSIPSTNTSASGVNRLIQPDFLGSVIHLLKVSPNMTVTEAAIGIMQNLTSDNFRSSVYLRAHIRDLNGIPPLVQYVECTDNNVAHSAVVALRNLAEDLENKKVIGKYGMNAIAAKLPNSLNDSNYSSKTAISSLYLIRLLIVVNKSNGELLLESDGLKKIVDINQNNAHNTKLRKAAGQVLVNAWELDGLRKKYKNLGLTSKDFEPAVQSSVETLKKSKTTTDGLSPETEKLIADSNV